MVIKNKRFINTTVDLELLLNLGGSSLNEVLTENIIPANDKKQFPKLIIEFLKIKSFCPKGIKA